MGSSLVVGYHEEHRSAAAVLSQKVDLPEEVRIQDYAPDLHMNMIHQVRVLGEVVNGTSTVLNAGTLDQPQWVEAVPIYPVGAEFMPIVDQRRRAATGLARRPMPRESAPDVANQSDAMANISGYAFAFAIVENRSKNFFNKVARSDGYEILATGEDRNLVRLSGGIVSGSAIHEGVSLAMLDAGIISSPESLLIEPRLKPVIDPMLAKQAANLQMLMMFFGSLAALVAFLLPVVVERRDRRKRNASSLEEVEATDVFPAVSFFQPIATQSELHRVGADDAEPTPKGLAGLYTNARNYVAALPRIPGSKVHSNAR